MHHRLRALLALALSAVLLALGAAAASAITIGPGGTGTLSGSIAFGGPRIAFRCGVTLDTTITAGTYGAGAAIGTVDRAAGSGCVLLIPSGTPITVEALERRRCPAVLDTRRGASHDSRLQLPMERNPALHDGDRRGRLRSTQRSSSPATGPLTAPFCASSLGNVSTTAGSLTHTPNWTIALP